MARSLGNAECPECSRSALVSADKREFLYMTCECGVFKYQSKKGQCRIWRRFEKANGSGSLKALGLKPSFPESMYLELFGSPLGESVKQEPKSEREPEPTPEKPKKTKAFSLFRLGKG